MQNSIDEIFEYLSWSSDVDTQCLGIQLASQIKHLSILIMPIESKSTWENCAKVLANKNDETLLLYLFELFEWLKDMNWPGAELIYSRLLRIAPEALLPVYKYSLSVAKQTGDHAWQMALNDFYTEYLLAQGPVLSGQGDGSVVP